MDRLTCEMKMSRSNSVTNPPTSRLRRQPALTGMQSPISQCRQGAFCPLSARRRPQFQEVVRGAPQRPLAFDLLQAAQEKLPETTGRLDLPEDRFDDLFPQREALNSDAAEYGGSGLGNAGAVEAEPIPQHGRPFSLSITQPPLAALYFTAG